jgi:hypothetical protein
MPQVAKALGITTSLAWRRYRRRQPVSDGREALPAASMSGLGRWQAALIAALSQQPVIAVNYAVALYLGREPTHSELVTAQRAARRLTEQYQVRICPRLVGSHHVPWRSGDRSRRPAHHR